ncbi:MAG TPA: insulinase family protein [Gemmatimonadaceae bacterium]|nr:insulinase family protein [Gemmatimonadaceae bacterium]
MPNKLLTFPISEHTLANDLRVIVVPTGLPDVVSVQIPVQAGSRNEVEPGKTGFAHFFEHMMFRGTEAYPPARYQEVLTRAGARSNAYTTDDYTNYHATFSRDDLARVLEIEGDRFQRLRYPEEDFKTEARAVLGEYNKNSADPTEKLFEVMRDHAYTTHTYKHTTMGFLRDIEDMPNQFDYSRLFFDRWYRPEYTTILVAGDVSASDVLPLVERYWGAWPRGSYRADVPRDPAPSGPVYAHVPWDTPTLPWVTTAFRAPAFDATSRAFAATDLMVDLWFGRTSALYRRLVDDEQVVDTLFAYNPGNVDPGLIIIAARVKQQSDAVPVRDAILDTVRSAREMQVTAKRVADAKAHQRYGFVRELDDTETIAATLARFVHYARTTQTLEDLFATYSLVTPHDVREAARSVFTDALLVLTTLSHQSLPDAIAHPPSIERVAARPRRKPLDILTQPTPHPSLDIKLMFGVGSAHDPEGKEGLAALAASMIAEGGSRERRAEDVREALFPMAATFTAQVDKEATTFTARVHRETWRPFADLVLPLLTAPGLREEDFARLRDAQRNALLQDLRSNNEEELGKERLQWNVFAGTRLAHPVLGTEAGLAAITLEDLQAFIARHYVQSALTIGAAGDVPPALLSRVRTAVATLPAGAPAPAPTANVARRSGMRIEIIQKETRAIAISLGHPIAVTRAHRDFAALWLARTWLGEHRSSVSHLYQRIREIRGLNYGDYAYIEAFPGGMFQFFPDANRPRHHQLFEIWIRPVPPETAVMTLKIALHELRRLIAEGLTDDQFVSTRDYLTKSLPLLTATQDHRLGYALDARWHGTGDFTTDMRERLRGLDAAAVNAAIRRHLSARDLEVVMIAPDARSLREALLSDEPATLTYDAPKPAEVLAEDTAIGAQPLGLAEGDVCITPVDEVFAR